MRWIETLLHYCHQRDLGIHNNTWQSSWTHGDDSDFLLPRRERAFVQLRATFTPGRQAVVLLLCGTESGYFPSICLLISNQNRHHLNKGLGEKTHQLVFYFRSSLCQCILNYFVGWLYSFIRLLRKKMYKPPTLHQKVGWGYKRKEIMIPALPSLGKTYTVSIVPLW